MQEFIQSLVDKHGDELMQFAGYVAVSGCALCIDFTIYWALLSVAKYAFVAAVGGYICGVLSHYLLSSRIVCNTGEHRCYVGRERMRLCFNRHQTAEQYGNRFHLNC